MKRLLILLTTLTLQAQSPHSVTLTWDDAINPPDLVTYTIYRSQGLCSGNITFAKIATGIVPHTFVDTTVITGNYCFTVTAVVSGIESAQTTPLGAIVPASSVTNFLIPRVQ